MRNITELKVYEKIHEKEKIKVNVYEVVFEETGLKMYQVLATTQGLIEWYEVDRFFCKSYRSLGWALKKANKIKYRYQVPSIL